MIVDEQVILLDIIDVALEPISCLFSHVLLTSFIWRGSDQFEQLVNMEQNASIVSISVSCKYLLLEF